MTFIFEDLRFRYPSETQKKVLAGVAAEIPAGRTTAIVGLSGSGKSTLLSLLGLLLGKAALQRDFVSGEISYTNREGVKYNHLRLSERDREELRLSEFGFVLQSAFLLPCFSVERNITMPLALAGQCATMRRDRLADVLLEFGEQSQALEQLLKRPANTCSGGERQRIAVLRALIHQPSVLFADEPTSNLDVVNKESVVSLLKTWKNGAKDGKGDRTLVLVTHDIDLTLEMADQILVLHGGVLVGQRAFHPAELGCCDSARKTTLTAMIRFGEFAENCI